MMEPGHLGGSYPLGPCVLEKEATENPSAPSPSTPHRKPRLETVERRSPLLTLLGPFNDWEPLERFLTCGYNAVARATCSI